LGKRPVDDLPSIPAEPGMCCGICCQLVHSLFSW
jgi:hypothetical protein